MERVFLYFFNMSLTASLLTVVILLLRFLFRKAPKALFCILWGFVAIRLIFPFSPESPLSLIPSGLTVSDSVLSEYSISDMDRALSSGQAYSASRLDTDISESDIVSIPSEEVSLFPSEIEPLFSTLPKEDLQIVSPLPVIDTVSSDADTPFFHGITFFATILWPFGMLAMLGYAGISYLRMRKKTKEAVFFSDNIWLCDHVATPFILGIFRPRILLPSSIEPEEAAHVIAHEKAHLKRLDHLWKPLGFILLSVYWFHPVLWIAYIFLCKDIELACDEHVIKKLDTDAIKSYSSTLLHYSVSRRTVSFCPLAFGEVHVKKRIKNVLHYKRPAFWIILLAIVSCITVAVCFLTDPVSPDTKKESLASEDMGELLFLGLTLKDTGTDLIGYEIAPEPYLCFTKEQLAELTLPVQWSNHNFSQDLTYGECFDILRYENGSWNSCATEEFLFPTIARVLPRKTVQTTTYCLNGFDLSKDGLYRFRAEPSAGQYLWFDFEVVNLYENNMGSLSNSTLLSIVQTVTKDRISASGIRTEYKELCDILLANGTATVACFVNELSTADEYGPREYFMAQICSELTGIGLEQGEYDPDTWWGSADKWLRIYNNHQATVKYNEMATDAGNLPSGTIAAWKSTALLSDTYHPKTPMPRALVWVNYFYNREKTPDGSLVMELPEFPGVTLYADSQKICADTPDGIQTLISGNTLWTTYLADLNTDSYPEICATVSAEDKPENLGIVVYDIKNKKTYELWDSVRYDYSLFGNCDSMFVQKTDRTGTEDFFVGELALTADKDTDSTTLTLTAVNEALYNSAMLSTVQLDLLGYSNLYADLAMGENRWTSNTIYPICHIITEKDWTAFTTAYPNITVWEDRQLLTLTEAFDADVKTYIEHCLDKDYYTAFYLSPHGLSLGVTSLPHRQGFSQTHKPTSDV